MNVLKYWTRHYLLDRLCSNLPVNNSIGVDPVFEHKFNSRKTFKLPYTQKIQILLQEYGFHDIQIQKPIYLTYRNFASPSIDLSLTEINKKKNIDRTNAQRYKNHTQFYTDDIKILKKT